MNTFESIQKREPEILKEYFCRLREKEKFKPAERKAATKIQTSYRCYAARQFFASVKRAVVLIQSQIRAFHARWRVGKMMQQRRRMFEDAFFCNSVLKIQSLFRGFYSRRYVYDYYAQKKYFHRLHSKGLKLKKRMEAKVYVKKSALQLISEQKERQEFDKMTSNSHHLMSTCTQPGVFNAPSGESIAYDLTFEEHIRKRTKAWNRSMGLTAKLKITR
eukprot:Platyproteum_vivax@DN10204_c0_g1_i1.p1